MPAVTRVGDMLRRLAAVGLLSLVIAGLAACTAPPPPDSDDAQGWVDRVSAAGDDRDDLVGSAVISTGSSENLDADGEPLGIVLDFPAPGVTIDGFEVSCFGGGTAAFEYEVSAATASHSGGGEVVCDEKPHAFAADGVKSGVVAVRVNVTADPPTYAYVEAVGAAPASDS